MLIVSFSKWASADTSGLQDDRVRWRTVEGSILSIRDETERS